MKKVLIGLSWVYANGRLHIGHVGSSLPADALARFHRLVGNDVSFVTGSDCYGTPILVSAMKEGTTPEALAAQYHELLEKDFARLGFTFDNYSKTMSDYHNKFAMDWHANMYKGKYVYEKAADQLYCGKCKKYLPDRYVEGTCPHCKKPAKGDSCDGCGKMLEPEELLHPKCKLCGGAPAPKNTSQLYLKLSAMQQTLEKYFAESSPSWSINAQGLAGRYLKEGLHDRAITRNIEWGIAVPAAQSEKLKVKSEEWADKRIYIWAENVLGYLSATKEFCEKTGCDWKEFLLDNSPSGRRGGAKGDGVGDLLHYYVHAKDNIPFHTIILPGLMLANPAAKWHLPDIIVASEYITLENKKISKSAGTLLTAEELSDAFDTDLIRYYFLRNINDRKDFNFTFTDFVNTVNGELINNFGNLVNRTLSFVHSKLGSEVKIFPFKIKGCPKGGVSDCSPCATKPVTGTRSDTPSPFATLWGPPLYLKGDYAGGCCESSGETIPTRIKDTYTEVHDLMLAGKTSQALKIAFDLVNFGNKYFDDCKPWISVKSDEPLCRKNIFEIITIIANIAKICEPFIPNACAKVQNWLFIDKSKFEYFVHRKDFKLPEVEILYKRLDMKEVLEKFRKYQT